MLRLAIIGSGDLGQQMAYHAKQDGHYEPIGFFDDYLPAGEIRHRLPILGGTEDVLSVWQNGGFDTLMVAVGYKHMAARKNLFEKFAGQIPFGKIIHSSCYVDAGSQVGEGSFLFPGTVVDMNVTLGNNVLVYTGCLVSHDSAVGHHSILSPGVHIAGFVVVEGLVTLGISTTIIDNLRICEGTVTGAGAVVVKNTQTPGLYIGCPAKLKTP